MSVKSSDVLIQLATSVDELLDSDELLNLAVIDSQGGNHDAAIAKLKRGIAVAPQDGRLHFMLAAEHAQIGLIDRAIEGMSKAVQLAPTFWTAHLQLGLMHYSRGNVEAARVAWEPLDIEAPDTSQQLFKAGLLKLAESDPASALPLLRRARRQETENAALAQDIDRILINVEQKLKKAGVSTDSGTSEHLFASTYSDVVRGGGRNDS